MVTDARVKTDPLDDLAGIQAMGSCVGIEFVEIGHPHRQIGVGKQLDGLGFGRFGEQHRYILLDRALLEQFGEDFGAFRALADDNA